MKPEFPQQTKNTLVKNEIQLRRKKVSKKNPVLVGIYNGCHGNDCLTNHTTQKVSAKQNKKKTSANNLSNLAKHQFILLHGN